MAAGVPEWIPWLCTSLVHVEACLVMGCLAGLALGDPGIMKRSEEMSLPLPDEVEECLRAGKSVSTLTQNIVSADLTYCVRCHGWQDESRSIAHNNCLRHKCKKKRGHKGFHHCSICHRCVANFDHHCELFGICIGGRGLSGNMAYFHGICIMALLGSLTCFASLAVGISQTPWFHWAVIALLLASLVGYLVFLISSVRSGRMPPGKLLTWLAPKRTQALPAREPRVAATVLGEVEGLPDTKDCNEHHEMAGLLQGCRSSLPTWADLAAGASTRDSKVSQCD